MAKSPLLIDIWKGDLHSKPNIDKVAFFGAPWHGIWLKGTQGTYYPWNYGDQDWFKTFWVAAKAPRARTPEGGPRYGYDWFRSAYAYLDVRQDGGAQAEAFIKLITEAGGGWQLDGATHNIGDLPPFLDIEEGGNPERPGGGLIEQRCREFNDKLVEHGLPRSISYGNVYMRENGAKFPNTGCQAHVVARYMPDLPVQIWEELGVPVEARFGWQYAGTGKNDTVTSLLKGYESTTPMGNADITAVFAPNEHGVPDGGPAALQRLRDMCVPPQLEHAEPDGSCSRGPYR